MALYRICWERPSPISLPTVSCPVVTSAMSSVRLSSFTATTTVSSHVDIVNGFTRSVPRHTNIYIFVMALDIHNLICINILSNRFKTSLHEYGRHDVHSPSPSPSPKLRLCNTYMVKTHTYTHTMWSSFPSQQPININVAVTGAAILGIGIPPSPSPSLSPPHPHLYLHRHRHHHSIPHRYHHPHYRRLYQRLLPERCQLEERHREHGADCRVYSRLPRKIGEMVNHLHLCLWFL